MTPQRMTPPLNRQPGIGSAPQLAPHPAGDLQFTSGPHLTSDQISDLLACGLSPQDEDANAAAHLRDCAECTAEFNNLREAISLFQEASTAYADNEFKHLQRLGRPASPVLPAHRTYPQTLFWVAASAVLMAGIMPLEMRWQQTLSAPAVSGAGAIAGAADSDEALLADIDRELSASVPAPMQALVDPTGEDSSQASVQTDTETPSQRKD